MIDDETYKDELSIENFSLRQIKFKTIQIR